MAKRGYQIIDPGLAQPEHALSDDAQVQCLSYLIRQIPEIILVPVEVQFEVISVQYMGGPYPAIGLFTDMPGRDSSYFSGEAFAIEEKLQTLLKETGIEHLRDMSARETLQWKDVLQRASGDSDCR